MAMFVGTEEEFNTYIGPRVRNKIQTLTKPFKAEARNTCAHCGEQTHELEAAHVHGFERKELIHALLTKSCNRIDDEFEIEDLAAFENELIEAHIPIDEHFFFLCRDCHRKYDKAMNSNAFVSQPSRPRLAEQSDILSRQNSCRDSPAKTDADSTDRSSKNLLELPNKEFAQVMLAKVKESDLSFLTDEDYCRNRLNHNQPILLEVPIDLCEAKVKSATLDLLGRQRYYRETRIIAGRRFAISNDWYMNGKTGRDNRTPFLQRHG